MSELNKKPTEEQNVSNVDKSRRRFTKAGAATPILLTLASQPAFGWGNGGMQCMSNMMSGNLSDPNRGNCELGWSPGGWCNVGGKVNGMDTIWAWTDAGYNYGVFFKDTMPPSPKPAGCTGGQKRGKSICYVGGSTIGDMPSAINADGFASDTPLRDIVCKTGVAKGEATDTRHCVVAYLNASLSMLNYILTKQQVIDLCNGGPVPGGLPLRDFLDTTWQ